MSYPTRVPDIGNANNPMVRLRTRNSSSLNQPYIALSHCWGKALTCRLVSGIVPDDHSQSISLKAPQAGIPIQRLSKTYQDAIAVARRLQVRYLWIDSLCILQDSLKDWKAESVRMGEVYQNAFCTLAATDSEDGRGGLFRNRRPSLAQPLIVTPNWSAQQSFVVVPVNVWGETVSESKLSHRAWALQERLLSPRVIHFSHAQVFWEGNSFDCCETFPFGLPKSAQDAHARFKGLGPETDSIALRRWKIAADPVGMYVTGPVTSDRRKLMISEVREDPELPRMFKDANNIKCSSTKDYLQRCILLKAMSDPMFLLLYENFEKANEPNDGSNGYYLWSRILEKYSRTTLSCDKDKLIAISGIAKHIEVSLDDTYVWRLWCSILPSQLLWRVEEFPTKKVFNYDSDKFPEYLKPPVLQCPRRLHGHGRP